MKRLNYVILKPDRIGDLMNGDLTELPVMDPAPVGSRIAIKTARNRRPTCHVEITACQPDPEGHILTVRPVPMPDTPRLLATSAPTVQAPKCKVCRGKDVNCGACNGTGRDQTERVTDADLGYTSQHFNSPHDEAEAVTRTEQEQFAKEGWAGFTAREQQRLIDRRLLALEERLKLAWGDGSRLGIDLSRDLRAIDRIVTSMEHKTDRSRNAA